MDPTTGREFMFTNPQDDPSKLSKPFEFSGDGTVKATPHDDLEDKRPELPIPGSRKPADLFIPRPGPHIPDPMRWVCEFCGCRNVNRNMWCNGCDRPRPSQLELSSH